MGDQDVIQHAATLMGGNTLGPYSRPARPEHKPMYHAKRVGKPAAEVMRRVWPWMGVRRSARIEEVLNEPHPSPQNRGIEWLSGLLEGEGSFWRSKHGCNYVKLVMTDNDVVEAAAALMPSTATVRLVPSGTGSRPAHWTDAWVYTHGGAYANATMEAVLEIMGKRRTDRILSMLVTKD